MNKPRLLVVEGSPSARLMLVKRLEQLQYLVESAENGTQALYRLRNMRPDLVLIDHALPDIDGFEVVLEITGSAETAHIPVLVMTSSPSKVFDAKARLHGARRAISKLLDSETLDKLVQEHLPEALRVPQNQDRNASWQQRTVLPAVPEIPPDFFKPFARDQEFEQLITEISVAMKNSLENRVGRVVDEVLERCETRLVKEIPNILEEIKPVLENAITDMCRNRVFRLLEENLESVMEQYAQQVASSMVRSVASLRREPSTHSVPSYSDTSQAEIS